MKIANANSPGFNCPCVPKPPGGLAGLLSFRPDLQPPVSSSPMSTHGLSCFTSFPCSAVCMDRSPPSDSIPSLLPPISTSPLPPISTSPNPGQPTLNRDRLNPPLLSVSSPSPTLPFSLDTRSTGPTAAFPMSSCLLMIPLRRTVSEHGAPVLMRGPKGLLGLCLVSSGVGSWTYLSEI